LARHIGEFGEIRITRLQPETTVAWEGEHASGTVEIEPSGWGTKVTLTAETQVTLTAETQVAPAAETKVSQVVEELTAVVEEPTAIGHEPASNGPESDEEPADAKMEETPTQPDPAVAARPAPARGWKRVIARTRTLFKPRAMAVPAVGVAPGDQVSAQSARPQHRMSGPDADAPREPSAAKHLVHTDAVPQTDLAESPVANAETAPAQTAEGEPEKAPPSIDPDAVLAAALDSLGQAHHRPFSRA
jgi:hypothetical protein